MAAGRLAGAAAIGVEVGKVISKYKTAKHFTVTVTDDSLTIARKDRIDAEAALDGFYVLRTPVPGGELDALPATPARGLRPGNHSPTGSLSAPAPVAYCVAAWSLTTRSAGTRPPSLTSMP